MPSLFAHPATPTGHVAMMLRSICASVGNVSLDTLPFAQWDTAAVDESAGRILDWRGGHTSYTTLLPEHVWDDARPWNDGTVFTDDTGSVTGEDSWVRVSTAMSPGQASLPLPADVAGYGVSVALPATTEALAAAQSEDTFELVQQLTASSFAAGLATSQAEHETHRAAAVGALENLESTLKGQRFLTGDTTITVGDLLLFSYLVRFDPVHYALHKVNPGLLEAASHGFVRGSGGAFYTLGWSSTFPSLLGFARDVWAAVPGVPAATSLQDIVGHHWGTYGQRLTGRSVVVKGLGPDWWVPPTDRYAFYKQAPPLPATAAGGVVGTANGQGGAVATKGEFIRGSSGFRHAIGSPGFPAEPGRYHLIIANNCPWCHRVALARAVKGLQHDISLDVLAFRRDAEKGWQFDASYDPEVCTPLGSSAAGLDLPKYIPELYSAEGSTERSVPILFDKVAGRIVNNESAEIVRQLNSAFEQQERTPDLYPAHLQPAINHLNAWIYPHINNGAYRAGFASSQAAYDSAWDTFNTALQRVERVLASSQGPFLLGEGVTEADLRLFPTLFRFDAVYHSRFRLNAAPLSAYPATAAWLSHMLEHVPGVAAASNLKHCKAGYYGRTGTGLVPVGPRSSEALLQAQARGLPAGASDVVKLE